MKYDVTVIGSGPGGYVAALRCAQLGFKTAIVERYPSLGGTCLNVGCIPSKALLDSSEHFHNASANFQEHGIKVQGVEVDMNQMIKRKDKVVKQTTAGINYLMKKNKVDVYTGHGSFVNKNKIKITKEDNATEEIETNKTIIATGSKPASLPNIDIDKKRVISSTEALSLKEVPKKMIIIGGGYIGMEMSSVYARIGTEVTVVEYMDSILPHMDKELGKELFPAVKSLGVDIRTSHKVTEVKATSKKVTVKVENLNAKKGQKKTETHEADYCLVCVGRKPYTKELGLENIGLETDEQGKIPVNDHLQTSVDGVYAIGDVVRGVMLAHKAEDEGVFVAEKMAGQKPHINYRLIPSVVYTWPEVASVGYTEEELKEQDTEYKKGSFPFKASGRARASMDPEGFVKVLAHKKTDEILGIHMIGPRIADIIAEGVTAMEYRASAEDVARMSHAHPTFTEAVKEACLAATDNRALHI